MRPLVLASVLALMGCGGGSYEVVRVQAGRAQAGRFVSAAAYQASLDAAIAEERGEWARAVELLRRARDEDPDGPELGARLGVALCQAGLVPSGLVAVDDALRADPELERGWTARARCRLLGAKAGVDRDAVRADLEHAVRCDADALEPVMMLIDLELGAGALQRARLRAEEAVVLHPRSARAFRVLAEVAARQGDAQRALVAAQASAALDDATGPIARAAVRDAIERSGVGSYALSLTGVRAPVSPDASDACAPLFEAFRAVVARAASSEVSAAADGVRAACPDLEGPVTLAEVTAIWSPGNAEGIEARALAAPSTEARRFGARMRLRHLTVEELLAEGALPRAEDRDTLALSLAAAGLRGASAALAETALDLAPAEPTVARLCAELAKRRGAGSEDPVRTRACALARTPLEKRGC